MAVVTARARWWLRDSSVSCWRMPNAVPIIESSRHAASGARALASDEKGGFVQVHLRRPLKLSTNAFCRALPG